MRLNRLPMHSLAAVRGMIGHGVEKLVERAFAANGVVLDAAGSPCATIRYCRSTYGI
jgi:phosphoglycolate phosphatase